MTRTQSILTALIGAAYLASAFHFEGTLSHILACIAGIHITAAFLIKGE